MFKLIGKKIHVFTFLCSIILILSILAYVYWCVCVLESLPLCAIGWSVVCGCGISWSILGSPGVTIPYPLHSSLQMHSVLTAFITLMHSVPTAFITLDAFHTQCIHHPRCIPYLLHSSSQKYFVRTAFITPDAFRTYCIHRLRSISYSLHSSTQMHSVPTAFTSQKYSVLTAFITLGVMNAVGTGCITPGLPGLMILVVFTGCFCFVILYAF